MISRNALTSLLENRIDHSALFPPTALTLNQTLEKTATFPSALLYPFMIGSELVIPLKDLGQIDTLQLKSLGFKNLFRICVINDHVITSGSKEKITDALQQCMKFNSERASHSVSQIIISFESKIKGINKDSILSSMHELLSATVESKAQDILFFVEPDLSLSSWQEILQSTVQSIKDINKNDASLQLGFKSRTSGPNGINRERLSIVIECLAKEAIPFKVTGGLHYALHSTQHEHGFLSLSIALVLARKFKLPASKILEILSAQDIEKFSIDDALHWDGLKLVAKDVAEVINIPHFSLGCCNPTIQDNELKRYFNKN